MIEISVSASAVLSSNCLFAVRMIWHGVTIGDYACGANRWFMGEDLAIRVMDVNWGCLREYLGPGLYVISYVFGLSG